LLNELKKFNLQLKDVGMQIQVHVYENILARETVIFFLSDELYGYL